MASPNGEGVTTPLVPPEAAEGLQSVVQVSLSPTSVSHH
jgi:hypothetical protein